METFTLLEKYLEQNTSKDDVRLADYSLNGSIIKLEYTYKFTYLSGEIDTMYDGRMEIDLLDYITFVYSFCTNQTLIN